MPLLVLLTFFAAFWAHASEGARHDDWVVEHWMPADGLPLNHLTGVAQTPDGMLWLTTLDGLVRFDGVRFVTLRPADLPGLPTSRLSSMARDDEGALWISTEQGAVVRIQDGEARTWSPAELGSEALVVLRQGRWVWVLCAQGVLRVEDGAPVRFGDPATWGPGVGPLADLANAPDGGLWLVGRRALLRLDGEGDLLGRYDPALGVDVRGLMAVAVSPQGEVLVVAEGALLRPSGGALLPVPTRGASWTGVLCAAIAETGGYHTVIGQRGAWRLAPDGEVTALGEATTETCLDAQARRDQGRWRLRRAELLLDGEPVLRTSWPVRTVLPTLDGVWAITNGDGLYFLRPAPVRMEGPDASAGGVLVGPSGERISLQLHGLVRLGDPPTRIAIDLDGQALPGPLLLDSLAADQQGRLWAGGRLGLCLIRGETCSLIGIQGATSARPLVVDGDGALWVDTDRGLGRAPPGWGPDAGWELLDPHGPATQARTAARTQDGSVVVAFQNRGLRLYREGEVVAWGSEDARGLDQTRALYTDPDGLLWIATADGGLCRLDTRASTSASRPAPRCLTRSQGLPADTIHAVTQDDRGRLWMSSNQGIFYVLRAEAEAALRDGSGVLSPLVLSERDGMANREANGLGSPNVGHAADGTLYFPTQAGIARVEPFPLPAPPQVRVESVRVNGAEAATAGALLLDPGQRDVSLTWTAPEFRWPDQLLFRYRLVGYSEAWSPLASARAASWTNLPPGDYTFEVEAALGGSWSRAPGRVSFTRAPAFIETPWFPICALLAALSVVVGLFWWRGRLRQARIQALEEEVRRRTAVLSEQNAALAESNQTVAEQAARLAQLDTLKSTFVSNLSHELRTPLTLVLGPLDDLLARPDDLDEHQRSTVRIAHRNAERLRELVGQLFDVARLETGGLPLHARPQDLGALVREVVERFLRVASERGVALETRLALGIVAWVDADLIDKILSNLLGNALRFTPSGGRVTVVVERAGEVEATVTVIDTGTGIPVEALGHIFERFYQVDPAGARGHGGAGIGLSLARDLVELHGGSMRAESTPGKGSVFRFTLPLGVQHLRPEEIDLSAPPPAPPPEAPRPAPKDEGEDDAGPRASVLVVEDHADMRAYIASHLAERFEVRTATDGRAALAAIRERRPDLVVSDVMMPDLDGIAMCREIRSDPALGDLPVILISAKGAEADRREGLEVASAWFSKPFRMRELLEQASRLAPPPPPPAGPIVSAPPSEAERRFLERLHAQVHAGLADPDLSVAKLSRALAMSRRQLLREVSRLTGQPVVAFIQRQRMETARDLLRQDRSLAVSEVASAVGMNRSYFSRLYSAWYGYPPSAERSVGEQV